MSNTKRTYSVRYIHKISSRAYDVATVAIGCNAFSDRKTLAKALRDAGILCAGERLREVRVEGDRVICFPDRGIWHSLTLTCSDV